MRKETEVNGSIVSINIHCPILKKDVVITEYYIKANESECETCGSHGDVNLSVLKCECGKTHEIEISSW